jgi:seryl-tRNA synthetase
MEPQDDVKKKEVWEVEQVLDEVWNKCLVTDDLTYEAKSSEEKIEKLETALDEICDTLNQYDKERFPVIEEEAEKKPIHFFGENLESAYCDGSKTADATNDLEEVTCVACFQKMVRSVRVLWIAVFPEFLRYSDAYNQAKTIIRHTSAGRGDTNDSSIAP